MSELIGVTGANGWVGGAVCAWLENRGYEVRRLGRVDDARTVRLDLTEPESSGAWRNAIADVTTLVHCAAHVHRPDETPAEVRLFQQVNVEGLARLVAAGRAAGLRRIVLAGSSAVYDWSQVGPAASETSPIVAATAYARSKLEGEQIVRASGLDWRIARLGTVFGAGDRANFLRLAQGLKRRRFVLPGRGAARKSVLPIAQAGEALGRLATEAAGGEGLLNVAAPDAPTLRDICDAFVRQCGFPPPVEVPLPLLRGLARAGDLAGGMRLRFPLTTATLRKLTTATVLDVSRMCARWPDLRWPDFDAALAGAADYYGSR